MENNSFCVSWFSNNIMSESRWFLLWDPFSLIETLSHISACFQKTDRAVVQVRDAAIHTDGFIAPADAPLLTKCFPRKQTWLERDGWHGPPSGILTSSQSSCDAQCVSWYECVPEWEGMGKNALPPFTVVSWAKTNSGRGTAGPRRFTWPRRCSASVGVFHGYRIPHNALHHASPCAVTCISLFTQLEHGREAKPVDEHSSQDEALDGCCPFFQRNYFSHRDFFLCERHERGQPSETH